jgi:hypothetical protein
MTSPHEADDKKKGRFKRLGGMIPVLAAVILMVLIKIYPLVPPPALATFAVLVAMVLAAVLNFLYERRKR